MKIGAFRCDRAMDHASREQETGLGAPNSGARKRFWWQFGEIQHVRSWKFLKFHWKHVTWSSKVVKAPPWVYYTCPRRLGTIRSSLARGIGHRNMWLLKNVTFTLVTERPSLAPPRMV